MKYGIYAYKDNINGFMQPGFDAYDESAIRGFAYSVSQPGLPNFRPEDYSLWKIGIYDSELGTIESIDPKLLVHATEVIHRD